MNGHFNCLTKSAPCTGCENQEETFEHLLVCSFPATGSFGDEPLHQLQNALKQLLYTPMPQYLISF
jgi:hypothetical protein